MATDNIKLGINSNNCMNCFYSFFGFGYVCESCNTGDKFIKYTPTDDNINIMNKIINTNYGWRKCYIKTLCPGIENVIFNEPATIVFWDDGTKTVVKVQEDDIFDPEKGLAMAISKKVLGNDYSYYNTILKWLKKYDKQNAETTDTLSELVKNFAKLGYDISNLLRMDEINNDKDGEK